MTQETKQPCEVCNKEYEGWGNNAWPLPQDVCCDECNTQVVMPLRLAKLDNKSPVFEDIVAKLIEKRKRGERIVKSIRRLTFELVVDLEKNLVDDEGEAIPDHDIDETIHNELAWIKDRVAEDLKDYIRNCYMLRDLDLEVDINGTL